MAEELKSRKDVPEELTWDLSQIYASEADMLRDAEEMKTLAKRIGETYRGNLDAPERIAACLNEYRRLNELMGLVVNYCSLAVEVDYYDEYHQQRMGKMSRLVDEIGSSLSFIRSELMEQPEEIIRKAMEIDGGNRCYLQDILRDKAHRLHPEAERVLSALGQSIYGTPYEIYNITKIGRAHV